MSLFGDVGGILNTVNKTNSSSSIVGGLLGDKSGGTGSLFEGILGKGLSGSGPLGELGIMSGFGDPINMALMATPFGAPLNILQSLGLPPLSQLLDKLGVSKLLKKIPGVGSALSGLSKITGGIKDAVGGIAKKIGGGIKKAVKKL
jgi:hypothetical protein